jgi:L-fuculose-phosphate aldolase
MLLEKERIEIVRYGNLLIERGLTTGSGGNISIYNRGKGLIALTPSSMSYDEIAPEDVLIIDIQGEVVDGARQPSTEIHMHLASYRSRSDVNAVVHTHSVYATAIACMGWALEPLHYLIAMAGSVVKCARYATYGTQELADCAMEALGNRGACLLGNHGLLAVGPTLQRAFSTAEQLEYVSRLYCITRSLGEPNILSEGQLGIVMDKFGTNPYK